MPAITVKFLDAARPQDKEYKLTVDRGLYLRVAPDGAKTWLVRYCVNQQQRQLRLAKPYGAGEGFLSLLDARAENARLQAMARAGTDPREEAIRRQTEEAVRIEARKVSSATFREMFDAWIRDGVRRATEMPRSDGRSRRTCCRCWRASRSGASRSTTCERRSGRSWHEA